MAKGQQRSNREVKKPKKSKDAKSKSDASGMFSQPPKTSPNPSQRKP